MSATLPVITLIRHGETAWTLTRQHTGRTDLPLTERGEEGARRLGARLAGMKFAAVFTSPLQRAARTCELAGLGAVSKRWTELVEWDYGKYEGRTSAEIRAEQPGWELFRDGCPGGESPKQVAARADRVVARLRELDGDVALFSSAHFLRALTARWLGLELTGGRLFVLGTASVSALTYEHDRSEPVVSRWNEQPS